MGAGLRWSFILVFVFISSPDSAFYQLNDFSSHVVLFNYLFNFLFNYFISLQSDPAGAINNLSRLFSEGHS